ncbi:hypothetical protein INR49_022191 [Caranx melampygus]|nr:hypothetical protein INR49_022191 [Caranx melampygus]
MPSPRQGLYTLTEVHLTEVMSSEPWVESCSLEGQGEDTGHRRKREERREKQEVEISYEENQPTGHQMQEVLSTLDHGGRQEVMSQGIVEQVQREEMQERRAPQSVERHRRMAFPRGLPTCKGRRTEEPQGPGPFYFFGGANGAEIVTGYCESRGWTRIHDKHRKDFKLKWCETKSAANYCNFREGEQLIYQIPNNTVLTTKIGLLSSLREYERVSSRVNLGRGLRRLKMDEFIPTTFRMDVKNERDAFFTQQDGVRSSEGRMWICKPTGLNQGRGIFLLRSPEELNAFRLKLQQQDDGRAQRRKQQNWHHARIVQQYIKRPLLLKGKKFDVRSYLLIACTAPFMVFFRHGYVRLTCDLYDPKSNNLSAHLTNQYMQKKNPLYAELKEDTVWSIEKFNTYVNDRFHRRMQQIMTQCFFAVKSKLDRRLGLFDLIGCDFMVDEDFKVWLLEMNSNPALHTNCEVLKEVIPTTVVETLDLTLEIFNKCRLRQMILPLCSQREFVLLHSGVLSSGSEPRCNKTNTHRISSKTPRTEPRRCRSGIEGKNVTSASPDDVSDSGGGQGSAPKTGPHHSTTSHLCQNSPSVQKPSHSHSSSHTVRTENHRPQVHLRLSRCTLHVDGRQQSEAVKDSDSHVTVIISAGDKVVST